MIRKISELLGSIVLVILPFLCSPLMGKHSPYFGGNRFPEYISICIVYAILSFLTLHIVVGKKRLSYKSSGGLILFLIGICIASIFGLAAPPDTSINMLQHPEREHFRYLTLFLAAVFFFVAFVIIIKEEWTHFPKWNRLIVIFFLIGIVEMSWEFYHHYNYVAGLRLWLDQGNKAVDFVKNYDNMSSIRFGAFGRLFQYTVVIWLSWILLKQNRVSYWAFIPILVLSLVGIFAAGVFYNYGFSLPENLKISMLFFIPGFPFILLYWIGVGMLTKFDKGSKLITEHQKKQSILNK